MKAGVEANETAHGASAEPAAEEALTVVKSHSRTVRSWPAETSTVEPSADMILPSGRAIRPR